MDQPTVPTAAVVVISENKVLLVKHGPKAKHYEGVYGLPSGKVEPEETELQTAARELTEETGLIAQGALIDFPNNFFHANIEMKDGITRSYSWKVFLSTEFSGELKASLETSPTWVNIRDLNKI